MNWLNYRSELIVLLKLGWPMTVSVLFYALMYPATLAFCGSLGLIQLDIASLAVSVFQLVVVPVENGLRWSCLTFFSQALGGTKKKRAGIIVQRSLTAAVCMWIVSFGLAINCANLLVLIGQDPEIAVGSQSFITILMPGCLCVLVFRVQMAYLDCLQKVFPTLIIHTTSFFICIALQALFVVQMKMGVTGSALGLCIALCSLPLMMTAYILRSGVHRHTWPGWSLRCLLQWKEYYKNLFPSIANQLVFVSSSEMGTFVAGSLGKSQLAVQGIIFQLFLVTMQPCVGAGSAAIARIGNYLGSGCYIEAKRVYRVILLLLGAIGIIECVTLLSLKDVIPLIFSTDANTRDLFSKIIFFVIPYVFFVSSAWGHTAALRGCNYHNLCVLLAFVSLWCIGHPLGLSLTFAASWGMNGLWTGYLVSSFAWNLMGAFFTTRLKWATVSQAVSGFAEKETDVEEFIRQDERKPLISKASQRSPDYLVPEASEQPEIRISTSRILKSKIPAFIFLAVFMAVAVAARLTVPQPCSKNCTQSLHNQTDFEV